MIFTILLILSIFTIAIGVVWIWVFKNASSPYEYFYNLGLQEFIKKNYKKAKENFEKAISLKDDFLEAKYNLALTLSKLKDYKNSRDILEKLSKTNPKDSNLTFQTALTYQYEGNYEEAIKIHEKILKEKPEFFPSQLNLGIIEFNKTNFEQALEMLKKASETNPSDKDALFYIARCKDEMCEYETEEDSQKILAEYINLIQDNQIPEGFNSILAKVYAKSGKIDETVLQCQKALAINPEDVEAYKLLGLTQLILKDLKSVKNTLTTALSLDSKNKEIHNLMSFLLCQQDDRCKLKKCRDKYQELIEKFLEKEEEKDKENAQT